MNTKKWVLYLKKWALYLAILLFTAIFIAGAINVEKKHSVTEKPWIKVISQNEGTIMKIGYQYSINWESSINVKTVTIALEKNGYYVKNMIWNLENYRGAVWTPDQSIQPGENYRIVITEPGTGIFGKSKNFTILKGCD